MNKYLNTISFSVEIFHKQKLKHTYPNGNQCLKPGVKRIHGLQIINC